MGQNRLRPVFWCLVRCGALLLFRGKAVYNAAFAVPSVRRETPASFSDDTSQVSVCGVLPDIGMQGLHPLCLMSIVQALFDTAHTFASPFRKGFRCLPFGMKGN